MRALAVTFTISALLVVNSAQAQEQPGEGIQVQPHEAPYVREGNPQLPKDAFKVIPGLEITDAERQIIMEDLTKLSDGQFHMVKSAYKQLQSGGPIRVIDMIPINHALMLDGRPGIRTDYTDRNADGTPKHIGLVDRLRKAAAEAVK